MHMDNTVAKKIDEFFLKYKQQKYKKGEILVMAGDDPSGIFYLKEGVVKKYAISSKGDEMIVNVFKAISFFPMSWAINKTSNAYFYEALTNLNVYRAPHDVVNNFIKHEPDVMYDLLSRVYRGTEGILTRMTYLMSGNANGRLITELIIQAKRFGKKKENGIEVKTSEKDIAAQSGMTRETVSREMRVLKDKGLVTFSKNILLIHSMQKLEDQLRLDEEL